jgi:hypothetical protein
MAKRRFKSQNCPNCGYRFANVTARTNYCPECGQENYDLNAPFRHLVKEAAETIFHFDTRSIRSLKALVFKPGFLTVEFMRGKRANYVKPMRFYIFISFLFFLLLTFPSGRSATTTTTTETGSSETGSGQVKSGGFYITYFGLKSSDLSGFQEAQLDSIMQVRHIAKTTYNKFIVKQLARIGTGGKKEFLHLMIKGVSYMMFILMPLVGFLIYIFFRKQEKFFIGTLIFSIHYHSFAFLLLLILLALSKIPPLSLILLTAPFALAWYLYSALRNVYKQTRIATLLKTTMIGILHVVSLLFLFLLTTFISLLIF